MIPSSRHPSFRGGPDDAHERLKRKSPEPKRRLQRRETAPTKKAWERQEDRLAEAIPKGRRTPGSGNGWSPSKKGDVSGELFRGEGKTRAKAGARSITVKRDHLEGIEHQARTMRQVPVFDFGFDDEYDWLAFVRDDARTLMHIAALVRRGDYDAARDLAEGLV